MKRSVVLALSAFALFSPLMANAQNNPPPPSPPPPMAGMRHMRYGFGGGRRITGIPPALAAKLGISPELQKKIQQLVFEANEQLINVEADLKRQRLELEKLLAETKPDSRAVLSQVDRVSRAEGEVRKNRIGLMLKIREALGPDLWQKLQEEMPLRRRMMKRRQFGGGVGPDMPPPGADDGNFGDEGGIGQ